MTARQKKTRQILERSYRPPAKAVELSFARLLETIPRLWDATHLSCLILWTDGHRAYPRSLRRVPLLKAALESGALGHRTWPSKAARTVDNPLFAVNYYDRELRKDIAAYRRESTCYSRNVSNGLTRFMSHLLYHNYQKPFRVAPAKKTKEMHAEMAGIDSGRIASGMRWLYTARPLLSRQGLTDEMKKIWLKASVTPLKVGTTYLPKYAR